MEIFVLKDGEQKGPIRIFELKDMLREGEIAGTDLAWLRGADSWKPLTDIDAVSWIFREPGVPDPLDADGAQAADEPPPLPGGAVVELQQRRRITGFAWIRFAARVLDWLIFWVIVSAAAVQFQLVDPKVLMLPSWETRLLLVGAWIVLEAALLGTVGTTPGKLLFGIRIAPADDAGPRSAPAADDADKSETGHSPLSASPSGRVPLPIRIALRRSLLAVCFGWGLWIPVAHHVALLISFIRISQTGKTYWDERLNLVVEHLPISPGRLACGLFALIGCLVALSRILPVEAIAADFWKAFGAEPPGA